ISMSQHFRCYDDGIMELIEVILFWGAVILGISFISRRLPKVIVPQLPATFQRVAPQGRSLNLFQGVFRFFLVLAVLFLPFSFLSGAFLDRPNSLAWVVSAIFWPFLEFMLYALERTLGPGSPWQPWILLTGSLLGLFGFGPIAIVMLRVLSGN